MGGAGAIVEAGGEPVALVAHGQHDLDDAAPRSLDDIDVGLRQ